MSEQKLGNPMSYTPDKEVSKVIKGELPNTAELSQAEATFEESVDESSRSGESGLGIPALKPTVVRVVDQKESEAHKSEEERVIREKAETLLAELDAESSWQIPTQLRKFCFFALILTASVLGIFLVSQVTGFVADINALSGWSKYLAVGGLLLFGGVILFVIVSLLWASIRLRRSPQLNLKSIRELKERTQLQKFAINKQSEARVQLKKLLKNYPINGKMRSFFTSMAVTDDEWNSLIVSHKRLLNPENAMSPSDWCDEFERCFQSVLDEVAKRRVKQYAKRVAIGTAASPIAMIDRMIVLYTSLSIVKDLLKIYNLRPSAGQSIVTISKAITHIYFSGMAADVAESAVDSISDNLAELSDGSLDALTGVVGRSISSKATEAGLNYFFLYRLGIKTIVMLKPIQ